MGIFLKCQHDSTYKDVTTANIILYRALHGDHWCHVATQLWEKRTVYFVSLFDGADAPTAFLRFTIQTKFLDWKDWQYYTILATEIVKGTSSLCSNHSGKKNFGYDFWYFKSWPVMLSKFCQTSLLCTALAESPCCYPIQGCFIDNFKIKLRSHSKVIPPRWPHVNNL